MTAQHSESPSPLMRVDEFDADEGHDEAPEPVDEQVAPQDGPALSARGFTPRKASGISPTMIRALKITAARIADRGDSRRMMLMSSSTGKTPMNIAGMIAKYLATSLATENVVNAPR